MTASILANGLLVLGITSVLWVWSVFRRDASVVDPWWSIFFLAISVRTAWGVPLEPPKLLLLGCVAVWSLRLWLHLLWRSRSHAEDPRYAAFRRRSGGSTR